MMDRRTFLRNSILALSAYQLHCTQDKKQAIAKPNIVLIYCDDLGWMDVGYNGNPYYQTPNIDKLARDGMKFNNAYANAPFCSPSRASLMSGLPMPRHEVYIPGAIARGPKGSRKFIPPEKRNSLDTTYTLFPELLQKQGYVNGHIGKWHLGTGEKYLPTSRGFDVDIGGSLGGIVQDFFAPYGNPFRESAKLSVPDKEGKYLTEKLTDEAVTFIETNREQPFFLFLSHFAPHVPIQAPEKLLEKYKKMPDSGKKFSPVYAAMVDAIDQSVGRVVDTLDRLKLSKQTLVMFYSDNGGYALATSNKPLRGSKGTVYEGGIRVPFCAKWPGVIPADTSCDEPIIGTDMFPTILDVAQIPSSGYQYDGESFLALLKAEKKHLNREAIFWYVPVYLDLYDDDYFTKGPHRKEEFVELPRNSKGLFKQDSTIVSHPSDTYPAWRTTPVNAVRKGRYKLIEFFERDQLELYDLKTDISESNNLAGQMPEKVDELYQDLQAWRKRVDAPFPLKKDPEYNESVYYHVNSN